MLAVASHPVEGHVSRGFEAVREAFAENFARRGELGGACCAYHHGEKVVDLWGGIRNKQTGEPWEQDTMVLVHSATKGLAAMTLATRPLPRLARLRRAGRHVLARVRAAGQGEDHRPPAPRPSGGSVRLRRARRSQRRRRSRSPGGGAGPSEAGVGARDASGLSRPHARVLRRRADAPRRSAASQPRTVLSGRDRDTARRGRLHPSARGDPELSPRDTCRRPDRSRC